MLDWVLSHFVIRNFKMAIIKERKEKAVRIKEWWYLWPEKAMAPHSSTLPWKIPWTQEPGRLQSMALQRVGHLLSDFTFTFHFHALEKEMATHSSVLAWKIPETEEPGGLPSVGSHRVEHDWSDLAAVAPTPSTLYDMSQRRQKVTFLECFFCMFSAFKDLNSIYCMFNPE